MATDSFDDLLSGNREYARSYSPVAPTGRAAKGIAVVTCIDSRITPLEALALRAGDAKILRNAGGRVTADVLRSLSIATALLGIHRIAVMHHTDCALSARTNEMIREAVVASGGDVAVGYDFMAIADAALAEDVEAIRRSPMISPKVVVVGWRYDVVTGLIHPVVG